ncbi:IS110 family transposase [Aquabacterium sp. A7-Y]|uniref:IS110 family transposase n=1 Tax=Aquabacterium sp. A7-Y TaxID=1349605 RepID=UPI00223E03C9|nr:IS110 family transposase [Aquabacterium sp. A7-Y]MCW7542146.1 IS110 family transposase [Aquabacterium sp. A7-Y]
MAVCVGIDVSKAKLDVAVLVEGKIKRTKVVSNDTAGFVQLLGWLESHVPGGVNTSHVCMEASGVYHEAVATFLYDHKVRVSVVNPLQIKRYAEAKLMRCKSDQADARLIAQFAAAESPPPWQAPPMSLRQLQALVARLDTLLGMQRSELNRLQTAHEAVQPSIQAVLDSLKEAIEQVREQIRRTVDDDPDLKRRSELLESIPGLGERTIPQLLAYIGSPERFTTVKALAAYAGLNPAPRSSGSSLNVTHGTSRHGHRQLKRILYFPAMVAGRFNPVVKAFWERLQEQRKPGKVIVVACMHKLLSLVYGVLKSGKPFDSRLSSA